MTTRDLELRLQEISRCRRDIEAVVRDFAHLPLHRWERLAGELIRNGADRSLGKLLCAVSLRQLVLDPDLLAECLKVVEPPSDFALPYRFQDARAVAPALAVAQSDELSWDRKVLAARVAAEMTLRTDAPRKPAILLVKKMMGQTHAPEAALLLGETLTMLTEDPGDSTPRIWITRAEGLSSLPADPPGVVIGGSYTVRRAVAKVGRNAACPCGSGRKYKKCCYDRDRKQLRDASPYEGVTMSQVRAAPDMVADTAVIDRMRAYEIKKLQPDRLNDDQLFSAYRRAERFKLYAKALELLLALETRPGKREFAQGHLEELMDVMLDDGEVTLARRVRCHLGTRPLFDQGRIDFLFALHDNREALQILEDRCRLAFSDEPAPDAPDEPLISMAYSLAHTFPALSVLLIRATIIHHPDRMVDSEMLMEVLRESRTDLGLDPWEDPIEALWDTQRASDLAYRAADLQSRELADLRKKLNTARDLASRTQAELKQAQNELTKQVAQAPGAPPENGRPSPRHPPPPAADADERETIAHLRQRVDRLKSEIQSQQGSRRQLRRQLQEEQERVQRLSAAAAPPAATPATAPASDPPAAVPAKVIVPEFTPAFRRSCTELGPDVAAKALRAATGMALNDPTVMRRVKRLARLKQIYRIRLDISHRLLVRWRPGEALDVLDMIPRHRLEAWINQHAG